MRGKITSNCNLTGMLVTKNHEVSLGCVVHLCELRHFWRIDMKKLVLAAALAGAASTASAGNIQEPIVEAPVIVEETQGSSSGIILPLVLLVLVAAAVASN